MAAKRAVRPANLHQLYRQQGGLSVFLPLEQSPPRARVHALVGLFLDIRSYKWYQSLFYSFRSLPILILVMADKFTINSRVFNGVHFPSGAKRCKLTLHLEVMIFGLMFLIHM